MNTEQVGCDCRDGVLSVTLNRPAKLNALTPEMLGAVAEALERAADDDVRVVILRGAGRSFCAGADVESALGLTDLGAAHGFLSQLGDVLAAISCLPKPVLAALQGHALGGGAELALEADLRIAADDAVLSLPDVTLGSTPASAYQLVRHVGKALAAEIIMLGTSLDAAQMHRLGLVTAVVAPENLNEASIKLAAQLRDRAGAQSLRFAKRALAVAEHVSREADLRVNLAAMLACQASSEQQQYVAEFTRRAGR